MTDVLILEVSQSTNGIIFNIRINKKTTKDSRRVPRFVLWRRRRSGAEGPGRLEVARHFGLDAFAVVVVNHLVGNLR